MSAFKKAAVFDGRANSVPPKVPAIFGGIFLKLFCLFSSVIDFGILKGYLRYKTIAFQNVSSEAQIKNIFIS